MKNHLYSFIQLPPLAPAARLCAPNTYNFQANKIQEISNARLYALVTAYFCFLAHWFCRVFFLPVPPLSNSTFCSLLSSLSLVRPALSAKTLHALITSFEPCVPSKQPVILLYISKRKCIFSFVTVTPSIRWPRWMLERPTRRTDEAAAGAVSGAAVIPASMIGVELDVVASAAWVGSFIV